MTTRRAKRQIREVYRQEMEELLVECLAFVKARHEADGDLDSLSLHGKIFKQLLRTGRIK
jgi:RNase P protein component